MMKENNLLFSYDDKKENDSIMELFPYINQKDLDLPIYNKNEFFLPVDKNSLNLYKTDFIKLDEKNNIYREFKIDCNEKILKEIIINNKNKDNIYNCDINNTFFDNNYINPYIEQQLNDNNFKVLSLTQKEFIANQNNLNIKKDNLFKTLLYHKRGRKKKLETKNKRIHYSYDLDNIHRKIQVHFITFLIRLANDALKAVFGKKTKFQFKDIKYTFKRKTTLYYEQTLRKKTYGDILQMKISSKFKNFDENSNKQTLIKVCEESIELKKLFEKNYLYMFQKYYFNITNNNKDAIDLEGLKIVLSPKTRAYFHLLKKNNINKEKFISITKDIYF